MKPLSTATSAITKVVTWVVPGPAGGAAAGEPLRRDGGGAAAAGRAEVPAGRAQAGRQPAQRVHAGHAGAGPCLCCGLCFGLIHRRAKVSSWMVLIWSLLQPHGAALQKGKIVHMCKAEGRKPACELASMGPVLGSAGCPYCLDSVIPWFVQALPCCSIGDSAPMWRALYQRCCTDSVLVLRASIFNAITLAVLGVAAA